MEKEVITLMDVMIEAYQEQDIHALIGIWNEVVREGMAFPQTNLLDAHSGSEFFAAQDFVGTAKYGDQIVGLYILHPNNVGRCAHQANASYAVRGDVRGLHIGEKLVRHSLQKAKQLSYRLLIFNAVVKGNERAIRLYEKLGFHKIGEIPGGFLLQTGEYQDIILYYHPL